MLAWLIYYQTPPWALFPASASFIADKKFLLPIPPLPFDLLQICNSASRRLMSMVQVALLARKPGIRLITQDRQLCQLTLNCGLFFSNKNG